MIEAIKAFLQSQTTPDPTAVIPLPAMYKRFKCLPHVEGVRKLAFLTMLLRHGVQVVQVKKKKYVVEGLRWL